MAKQNGRRPLEAQSEPSLPIPPGAGTYHRGLQNFVESSRATGQREKVIAVFVSAQQTRRPIKVKGWGERFFKALVKHN